MGSEVLIDFSKVPLSKLSYIVMTDVYSDEEKNAAYKEIKKRFLHTGCNSEVFMEYEEEAFEKRGELLSSYLISHNPSGQLLMQLYLEREKTLLFDHSDMLFSELLLCNGDTKNSFFTKAVEIELANIRKRLQDFNGDSEELANLKKAYFMLRERLSRNYDWKENSLTMALDDITLGTSSIVDLDAYCTKHEEKLNKAVEKLEQGKKLAILTLAKPLIIESVTSIESLDALYKHYILSRDMARLNPQRKAILKSLRSGKEIDYSFLSNEGLKRTLK